MDALPLLCIGFLVLDTVPPSLDDLKAFPPHAQVMVVFNRLDYCRGCLLVERERDRHDKEWWTDRLEDTEPILESWQHLLIASDELNRESHRLTHLELLRRELSYDDYRGGQMPRLAYPRRLWAPWLR